MQFPKITIVTANYNGAAYLEDTIRSLVDQGYPNLEYIVVDGGSTDGSQQIIEKYQDKIAWWVSEPDNGLYDAIQKGFDHSTGDIMGWLNSDDMHHRKSLFAIAEIFTSFPEVNWLTGNASYFDEGGRVIHCWGIFHVSQYDYMIDHGAWLQQESTFWRRPLWQKAGSYVSTDYKYASDFELWTRFFRLEQLYITDTLLAGFRFRSKNQLTLEHLDDYKKEVELIKGSNIPYIDATTLKKYKRYRKIVNLLLRLKVFNYNYFDKLGRRLLHIKTPVIVFDRVKQQYQLTK